LSTAARIADLQAVGVGHVGTDRDCFVSSEVSGFLAGLIIDLSNGDSGALASEQDCGGAADPVTGARDEGYPAREPWHRSLLRDCKFKNSRTPAVHHAIS
jgi:hypothetical protein